jgi:UDP-N-acetylmuramate dehydrogenase
MPFADWIGMPLAAFAEIVKPQEPLVPYTALKLGGQAQFLAQPRSVEELVRLLAECQRERLPVRVLGGGANLLIRDEGVRGVVLRLTAAAFTAVELKDKQIRAGGGASLSSLISEAARHSFTGLESLIGLPGTVGGALRCNAGTRSGYIGELVEEAEVVDREGNRQRLVRSELDFNPQSSSFEDAVVLSATFRLETDNPDTILKRMRKFWIHKKAHQPLSFQSAVRLFRDPRGQAADQLIEQAGLAGSHVGKAELSERNVNYLVVQPGATARDVLRLIDLVRTKVSERFGQTLELALMVW